MNTTQDLIRILCLLKPGMKLTVPDAWVDENLPGSRVERARRVEGLASEFSCALKHGIGTQTFERLDYPRLG